MLLLNGSETFFIDASASYTEKATQNDYMPVVVRLRSITSTQLRINSFEKKKIACYSFIIHYAILLNDNNISIQSIYVTFALSRRILIL